MNIARAWKDAAYRESLTAEERAALPANPAGVVELDDQDLMELSGGTTGTLCVTVTLVTVSQCATSHFGCATVNKTVCNGTCAVGGTKGCCPQ
ncbi:mersacidin/lichenicidin family type 2 lantibiotic [Streptomyces sp. NPDC046261]|uniref:mersacidin/lichenicidin family type 2 lantibiotic n=1 Tax=Streptomyces sp. NPDC046261 TaxID=3157200 RepID=UPI00340B67EF